MNWAEAFACAAVSFAIAAMVIVAMVLERRRDREEAVKHDRDAAEAHQGEDADVRRC